MPGSRCQDQARGPIRLLARGSSLFVESVGNRRTEGKPVFVYANDSPS